MVFSRTLILLLWTGIMIVAVTAFLALFFRFYAPSCGPLDSACARVGTFLILAALIVMAIVYGIGLGIMAQRWMFGRRRS